MILFRTYLSDFDHWHEWPVGPDPVRERTQLAFWIRGMPYLCDDGAYSIPFTRVPDRTLVLRGWRATLAAIVLSRDGPP